MIKEKPVFIAICQKVDGFVWIKLDHVLSQCDWLIDLPAAQQALVHQKKFMNNNIFDRSMALNSNVTVTFSLAA